jgi:MFS family permease
VSSPTSPSKPLPLGVIFLTLYIDLIGFSLFFPLGPELLRYYLGHEAPGGLFHWLVDQLGQLAHDSKVPEMATAALFGGCVASVYSLMQFLFSPVWGARSDRTGRRPVLLLTVAGSAVSYLLLVFSGSFVVFLVSRVLAGIMGGNLAVAVAAVADVTSRENRAKGMGLVGAAFGLGFLTGPAIGGLTAGWDLVALHPGLAAWGLHPFSGVALIGLGLCLVNLVWVAFAFRETLPPERRGTGGTSLRERNPIRALLTLPDRTIRRANAVGFLFIFAFSFFETLITFFVVDRFGWTPRQLVAVFVFNGVVSILTQGFLVRRAVPALGEKRAAVLGLAAVSVGLLGIGLGVGVAGSVPLLYAALACCAVGSGFANVGLSSLISLYAPPEEQGKVTGIFRSLGFLARASSPAVAGLLFFHFGGTAAFATAAAILLVPLALGARLPQPAK